MTSGVKALEAALGLSVQALELGLPHGSLGLWIKVSVCDFVVIIIEFRIWIR